MMLRNRSLNATNENDSLANHSSVKGAEKRASKGLGDVSGPEPKRVALTDISSVSFPVNFVTVSTLVP